MNVTSKPRLFDPIERELPPGPTEIWRCKGCHRILAEFVLPGTWQRVKCKCNVWNRWPFAVPDPAPDPVVPSPDPDPL